MRPPRPQSDAPPWWLWPNVLNLDAPLVAVLWQEVFARNLDAPMDWAQRALLFLAVWLVYFADRWLDARQGRMDETCRHRFHRDIGDTGIRVLLPGAVAAVMLAAHCLNSKAWAGAVGLLVLTAAHFGLAHSRRIGGFPGMPKEFWVGCVFSAGCALQPWSLAGGVRPQFYFLAALFAALCFLNCLSITVWEDLSSDRANHASLPNRWPLLARSQPWIASSIFASAMALAAAHRPAVGFPLVALSAAGLFCLHGFRSTSRRESLRALADVALLTPILALAGTATTLP